MTPRFLHDERERRGGQPSALELGFEEALERGRGLVATDPTFVGIAKRKRKPLPAHGRSPARLRRVRGDERGVRKQCLPGAPELDEVVSVGAITVQEHDESARAAGARLEPRPVQFSRHCWLGTLERESHRAF